MRKLFTLCLLVFSLSASAQWQQTGSKVRYVNGLGIPTKDTAAGVLADSSQILIRPADSSLYVKYKRTWVKVGGGTVSGTPNRVSKFTGATTVGNSSIVDSASAVAMTITPSGSIGIGTNPVSSKLEVNGGIRTSDKISSSTSNANGTATIGTFFNNANITQFVNNQRVSNATEYGFMQGSDGKNYIGGSLNIVEHGRTLIGTTTDNGVDRLQVSGSGYFSGSGVIGKFDGTSTNNAYIDFRTSGTTKWQLGNNAASSHDFNLTNSATSVNSMVVNSSNQIGFNMQGGFLGANSAFEFHKTSSQFINRYFSWSSSGLGVQNESRTSRSNTYGSYSATLSGDPIYAFVSYGSSNSAHVYAGLFGYYQNGSTSTYVPGYWQISASGGSSADRAKINVDGGNDRLEYYTSSTERMRITSSGRVLMGSTLPTDNGTDALQVNGPIQGNGFDQAYLARTTAYTATDTDYLIDCTTGTFTVTLPASSGRTGRILIIKNSGTGTITVDGNAAETIDGAATYSLSVQYATVQIMSDGTNWKIIAKF